MVEQRRYVKAGNIELRLPSANAIKDLQRDLKFLEKELGPDLLMDRLVKLTNKKRTAIRGVLNALDQVKLTCDYASLDAAVVPGEDGTLADTLISPNNTEETALRNLRREEIMQAIDS